MKTGCISTLYRHVSRDGCLRVYCVGRMAVNAFTDSLECLKQIVAD